MDDNNSGTIKISEDVISTIAITAANEIEGVAKIHQKINPSAKGVVGTLKVSAKGVSIVTTDKGLDITVQISVKNGYKIPEVASGVQKSVHEAITNMTGIVVNTVNVIVSNVVEEEKVKAE